MRRSPTAGLARIEAAIPAHLEHLDEYFVGVLTPEELQQLTRHDAQGAAITSNPASPIPEDPRHETRTEEEVRDA